MITTGRYVFPYRENLWLLSGQLAYWDVDNNRVNYWSQGNLPPSIAGALNLSISSAMSSHRNVFQLVDTPEFFGPLFLSGSGVPPNPISFSVDLPEIRTNNATAWFASKADNSIVFSDFMRGTVSVREIPGYTVSNIGSEGQYAKQLHLTGLFPPSPRGVGWVLINGVSCSGTINIYRRIETHTSGGYPADVGFSRDVLFKDAVEAFRLQSPDPGLVVSTLSDANIGVMDALTALAEAPEALKSAFKGCINIVSLYKDTRAKEFRLRDTVSRKVKNAPLKERALLLQQLADAIAGVWLNYRLNIEPTALGIEAAMQDAYNGARDFLRYRNLRTSDFTVSGQVADEDFKVSQQERCLIKRCYSSDSPLTRYGWNPTLTAWELIPLSFVVDRYINIGEAISAFTSPVLSVEQGATYSWKASGNSSVVLRNNSVVELTISGYSRKVINPDHYCGINFPVDRSFKQDMDHLALAWMKTLSGLNLRK